MFENLFNQFNQEKVDINSDRLRSRLSNFYNELNKNRDLENKWGKRQSRDSLWENGDQGIMMEKFEILFVEFFFEYELLCYEKDDGKKSKHKHLPFNSSEIDFLRKRFNERSDNSLNRWGKLDNEFLSITDKWEKVVDSHFYLIVLSNSRFQSNSTPESLKPGTVIPLNDDRSIVNLPNGSTYVGQTIDGIPYGQGSIIHSNGDEYVGRWYNGNRHGLGRYTFSEGSIVQGRFKDGKLNGPYSVTDKYGKKYFKEFKDGDLKKDFEEI